MARKPINCNVTWLVKQDEVYNKNIQLLDSFHETSIHHSTNKFYLSSLIKFLVHFKIPDSISNPRFFYGILHIFMFLLNSAHSCKYHQCNMNLQTIVHRDNRFDGTG